MIDELNPIDDLPLKYVDLEPEQRKLYEQLVKDGKIRAIIDGAGYLIYTKLE